MVSTLNHTKRAAIGMQLASMKAIQELLIFNEKALMPLASDGEIRDRLQKMLDDDHKNLGVLDTVITQYGNKEEPKQTVTEFVQKAKELTHSRLGAIFVRKGVSA